MSGNACTRSITARKKFATRVESLALSCGSPLCNVKPDLASGSAVFESTAERLRQGAFASSAQLLDGLRVLALLVATGSLSFRARNFQ